MSDGPDVSVVITAHNAGDTLPDTLRALGRQTGFAPGALEVVVVDDRSTDGTAAALGALGMAQVRVVSIPVAQPASRSWSARQRALDAGVSAARAERILLLDADALPPPHWARTLADALQHARVVGGCVVFAPQARSLRARYIAALQTTDAAMYLTVCSLLSRMGRASGMLFGSAGFTRAFHDTVGGFASLGFTLTEDLHFARAAHRHRERLSFSFAAPVAVRGARTVSELVRRALRVSATGGVSALSLALGAWALSLPALAILATLMGGVWTLLLVARYVSGVGVLWVALLRSGATRYALFALVHDVVVLVLGMRVAVAAATTREIDWGGVRYDRRHASLPHESR